MPEDWWQEEEKWVFGCIWKSPAPLKMVVFSRKALLDRIPTKFNLRIRNVLPQEVSALCVLCDRELETAAHILLHCYLAWGVWSTVMMWWNFSFVMSPNLFTHWDCWSGVASRKRLKKGLSLVWHASIWV